LSRPVALPDLVFEAAVGEAAAAEQGADHGEDGGGLEEAGAAAPWPPLHDQQGEHREAGAE
jgi:hypothetical protein